MNHKALFNPKIGDQIHSLITDLTVGDYPVRQVLNIWKGECMRFKCLFIKAIESKYVVCITITNEGSIVLGAWDIEESIGFLFPPGSMKTMAKLSELPITISVIPPGEVSKDNTYIFNKYNSPKLNEINENAKSMLQSMMNSPEHKNKPLDELANRAVIAASSLHNSMESFTRLYFRELIRSGD